MSRVWRAVAASPPLLMALLIARLYFGGTLTYYVNAQTVWVVLAGGVLFLLTGCVLMHRAWSSRTASGPSWRTLIFLLPVLLGLLVPARPLSAMSGQSSSLGALQLTAHVSTGAPGDAFATWLHNLGDHPDPSWWAGRRVTLVGMVADEAGLPPHSFIVGRYLVTCCVVDATLLGFPVRLTRGPIPPDGAWVQVSGVFGRYYWVDPAGAHYPLIFHARLAPVTIPSSPYLSP